MRTEIVLRIVRASALMRPHESGMTSSLHVNKYKASQKQAQAGIAHIQTYMHRNNTPTPVDAKSTEQNEKEKTAVLFEKGKGSFIAFWASLIYSTDE